MARTANMPPPDQGGDENEQTPYDPSADLAALGSLTRDARDAARQADYESGAGLMRKGRGGKAEPKTRYAVRHDRYDEMAWKRVREDNPDLDKILKGYVKNEHTGAYEKPPAAPPAKAGEGAAEAQGGEKPRTWPHADEIAQDIYSSLYQAYPQLEDPERMDYRFLINHVAIDHMMQSRDYEVLHGTTLGDEFASGVGIQVLSETILQNQQLLDAAQTLADQEEPVQNAGEDDEDFAARLKAWQDKRTAAQRAMRVGMRNALQQAQQGIQEAGDAVDAFGGGQGMTDFDDEQQTMNAKQKAELARDLLRNPQLRRIVQFAGRFKRLAWQAQHSKVDYTPDEVFSVTQGRDISRLLPTELMRLADPDQEDLFFRDFTEARCQQYELNRPAKEMRGPIIVAIDESGSMSGDPDAWAKATFLALHGIAKEQERDIRLIHFSSGRQIKVEDFLVGQGHDPKRLVSAVLHFYGGGTDYDPWMERAMQAIEESQWSKADVILISDGAAFVSDSVRERWHKDKIEKAFRAYGILIMDWGGAGEVEAICDEFTQVRTPSVGDPDKDTDVLLRAFSV